MLGDILWLALSRVKQTERRLGEGGWLVENDAVAARNYGAAFCC
jgi:hypothetical protein